MPPPDGPRRRVLLTCHDAGGTVPPMLAIAEALLADGHEVVVLGQPSVRVRATALGCTFVAFSHLPDYRSRESLESQIDLVVPALTGAEVGDDLRRVVERHGIDVTLTDANLAGALAAAEVQVPPSAVLLHSMFRTFVDVWMGEVWPLLGDLVNDTRAGFGLAPSDTWSGLFAGHDRIVPVVPTAFDAPVPGAPTLDHFGFLVPTIAASAPVAFPPGVGPKVLVGLTTTYMEQEGLLESIVAALASIDVRGVVTTGSHIDAAGLDAPPMVTVLEYADHGPLLREADVMVTHAGLGSVAAALQAGVPLVCTPIGRDQMLNADRVVTLGAGVALPSDAAAADIASAVTRVASDAGMHAAAQTVARASADEGGATAAAHALVDLAR